MSTVVGTNLLVRYALRRDRVLASVWVLVLVLVCYASAAATPGLYPTVSERVTAAEALNASPAIVALLADDPLGAAREEPDDQGTYDTAYDRVVADPGQHLVVAERDGSVVGTLQLSVIPGLSRRGATRSIIATTRFIAGLEPTKR